MASLTVNPDYKLIGNNIKQMRTKSQVSQQSLAKAINISQTHMSNLESEALSGRNDVSMSAAPGSPKCKINRAAFQFYP